MDIHIDIALVMFRSFWSPHPIFRQGSSAAEPHATPPRHPKSPRRHWRNCLRWSCVPLPREAAAASCWPWLVVAAAHLAYQNVEASQHEGRWASQPHNLMGCFPLWGDCTNGSGSVKWLQFESHTVHMIYHGTRYIGYRNVCNFSVTQTWWPTGVVKSRHQVARVICMYRRYIIEHNNHNTTYYLRYLNCFQRLINIHQPIYQYHPHN